MEEEIKKEDNKKKKSALRSANKLAKSLVDGVNINLETVVKQIPFILFLALIAILYIANSYYAENTVRDINKVKNELKDLRAEYIYGKSELMFSSRQSEVAAMVADQEIKESTVPPQTIIVNKKEK
jgi:ABC-type transport system involved in cytochrome bd biosynthesis fused ATPase/permease subunit